MKYIIAIVAIVAATGIITLLQPRITAQLAGSYQTYYPEERFYKLSDGAMAYSTLVFDRIAEAIIRMDEHSPTGESRFQRLMTELHIRYPNATNYAVCYALNDGKIVCGIYTRADYEAFLKHDIDERHFGVYSVKRATPLKQPTAYTSIEAIENDSITRKQSLTFQYIPQQ